MRRLFCSIALLLCAGTLAAQQFTPTANPTSPDGTAAIVDLPTSQHMRNVGGSDGSGLCVFTSLQHAAYWQNVRTLDGFRAWMQQRPGGGWPEKVDQTFAQFCREKGRSVPPYIQHTGGDDSFLELALKTDRVPCVTYDGRDDFYRDRFGRPAQIAHMVNLAHLDAKSAAIIDNNRPGYWVWMSRADFLSRWRGNSGGWAVVLLAPPPPPHPPTQEAKACECDDCCPCAIAHPKIPCPEACQMPCKCCEKAGKKTGCICGDSCKCKAGDCPAKCPVRIGPKIEQNCPNGGCRLQPYPLPAGPLVFPNDVANSSEGAWIPDAVSGKEWGYWRSGKCVARCFADGRVEAVDAQGFATGKPIDPPAPLPAGAAAKGVGAIENHGVRSDRIHDAPTYTVCINGRVLESTKTHAHALLAPNGLNDDSDHWHLTCVGTDAVCALFLADVRKLPASVQDKLLVQTYAADHWAVSVFGLPQGVNLRKPSPGRIAADVGTLAYADGCIADLLAREGGPLYVKPAPAPPSPKIDPTPAPQPNNPAPVNPTPAPVPDMPMSLPLCCLALVAMILYVFRRPAPPPS